MSKKNLHLDQDYLNSITNYSIKIKDFTFLEIEGTLLKFPDVYDRNRFLYNIRIQHDLKNLKQHRFSNPDLLNIKEHMLFDSGFNMVQTLQDVDIRTRKDYKEVDIRNYTKKCLLGTLINPNTLQICTQTNYKEVVPEYISHPRSALDKLVYVQDLDKFVYAPTNRLPWVNTECYSRGYSNSKYIIIANQYYSQYIY